MADSILIPGAFTVMTVIEAILGLFILLADHKATRNRVTFSLMMLFSINNISVIGMITTITPRSALFYHWLLIATTFAIGPAILLTSLYLLRPTWGRLRVITWILMALMLAAPIISTLDALGVSQAILGEAIFFVRMNPAEFLSGFIGASELTTGTLRPIFLSALIGLPIITLIFPTLYTGIQDRKQDPENSNFAYILFAVILASILFAALRGIIRPSVAILGQNMTFTIGFAYVGLLSGSDQLANRRLPQAVADWSMINKLRLAVGMIALPAVVISGVVAVNFFQSLLVDTTGEDISLLAEAELRNVTDEVNRQVDNLLTLAEDPLVISSATFRESTYFNLSEEEIQARIEENEAVWSTSEDDSSFVTSQLSSARSSSLQRFSDLSPAHIQIVLSDLHGALYTATERTESYDFSSTDWWLGAYNDGNGAIFISNPTFDSTVGQYLIEIAVPVYSQTRENEIFGVLLSRFSLEEINRELQQVELGETGGLSLFSATGEWLPTDPAMAQTDPNLNWDLITDLEESWAVTSFGGLDSIISWSTAVENQMDTYIDFRVVAHLPAEEALAGIVFMRNAGYVLFLLIAAGVIAITFLLANFFTQPLAKLTEAAAQILEGETGVQAEVMGRDEIGTLASTFNTMTTQLTQLVLGLEETVEDRTRDLGRRALQLETAAEIARESAAIRDVNQLLENATRLISERFGYYHTGIFLLDEDGKYALLKASNSPGGQRMLARGHKLEVGKVGVVGYSAGQGEPRIAQDVGADVIYYDNPDMPATRSEMALPLMIHGEVIGVLDVQSDESNAFGKEDVQVLQTLADQIALAIENARLLESSQTALSELEYLYGREIGQAWQKQTEKKPLAFTYTPAGIQQGNDEQPSNDDDYQVISREITYRGHSLGTIDLLREKSQRPFTEDELAMVNEVMEQTALALENARLSEQIRLRSDQIQLLQEVTAMAASTLDEDRLLINSAERMQAGINVDLCAIALFSPNSDDTTWRVVANKSGEPQTPTPGYRFGLNNEVTLEVIRAKQAVVFYDVQNDTRRQVFSEITGRLDNATIAIIPMVVREQVIGMICLADSDPRRRIDAEEINLLNQISSQVSGAIDVVQLFEAEQEARVAAAQRAEREHLVASITTKVRASNDPETIIRTAIDELRTALAPGNKTRGSINESRGEEIRETNGQELEGRAEYTKDENNEQ